MNKVKIDIDADLMRYVVGYNMVNMKELREKFPTLKINSGKTAIYIEGSSELKIDACRNEVDNIVVRAIGIKNSVSYKKRIKKEIENKRRAAAAANRIRDKIESEFKELYKEELADKMGLSTSGVGNNMIGETHEIKFGGAFAGLEIEDD